MLSFPARLLLGLIRVYRLVLSPDHGIWARSLSRPPFCRHYPTCSSYAIEALEKHGALRGGVLATRRVLRCHPWSSG